MLLIIDIDGTLADNGHRRVFLKDNARDWASFYQEEHVKADPPYPDALRAMKILTKTSARLVILTGRPERLRAITSAWLKTHYDIDTVEPDKGEFINGPRKLHVAQMFMRSDKDFRYANVFKESKVKWLYEVSADKNFVFIDDDTRCYGVYSQFGVILVPSHCWKAIQ